MLFRSLAIVKGFVEANGGSISVQSLPGQGTSFVVSLPSGPRSEPWRQKKAAYGNAGKFFVGGTHRSRLANQREAVGILPLEGEEDVKSLTYLAMPADVPC